MASTFKKYDRVRVIHPNHSSYLKEGTVIGMVGKLINVDFLINGMNYQGYIPESQLLKIGSMKDSWRKR